MMSEGIMNSRMLIARKPLTNDRPRPGWPVLPVAAHEHGASATRNQDRGGQPEGLRYSTAGCRRADQGSGRFQRTRPSGDSGPRWQRRCGIERPVEDKNNAQAFAKEAAAKNCIEIAKSNPNRATIIVGEEEWPLPIPLVKTNGKWYFNSKEGRQEILFRRIGENELNAITVCRGYVSAQMEYASEVHDNSGINQYAQKIISTPGKQDGLSWKNADGTSDGPIGEAVAKALGGGLHLRKGGFHGYYFKILKGQGPSAPNGAINYVIEGVMIGGFALVAVPAEYRVTGVKTFIVSYDGVVYQKDLGPDSLNIVKKMELYNPDKTWQRTNDQWPQNVATANP